MNSGVKKILWGVFAIILVVVCVVWFIQSDLKHIEDTNGADNYSLTTITDENIINQDMGALGFETAKNKFAGDTIEFHSNKFTGVCEILYDNLIGSSDFTLNISNFAVNSGNFKMAVVHNDEIVKVIEPGTMINYTLEDVSGTVSLVIAGESADFSFSMSQTDYELHSHQ